MTHQSEHSEQKQLYELAGIAVLEQLSSAQDQME